jgi:hypothetical protein
MIHTYFDVLKCVPADATLTPSACSETAALSAMLQPGRLYVIDRGYTNYELFAKIVGANSSLIARVRDRTAFVVQEERPLTAVAKAARIRSAAASQRFRTIGALHLLAILVEHVERLGAINAYDSRCERSQLGRVPFNPTAAAVSTRIWSETRVATVKSQLATDACDRIDPARRRRIKIVRQATIPAGNVMWRCCLCGHQPVDSEDSGDPRYRAPHNHFLAC